MPTNFSNIVERIYLNENRKPCVKDKATYVVKARPYDEAHFSVTLSARRKESLTGWQNIVKRHLISWDESALQVFDEIDGIDDERTALQEKLKESFGRK